MPGERLENSLALHLVFCQVVQDVYNNGCIRINKEDRIKMRGMLGKFKMRGMLGKFRHKNIQFLDNFFLPFFYREVTRNLYLKAPVNEGVGRCTPILGQYRYMPPESPPF